VERDGGPVTTRLTATITRRHHGVMASPNSSWRAREREVENVVLSYVQLYLSQNAMDY
jgi:hypothetical protein